MPILDKHLGGSTRKLVTRDRYVQSFRRNLSARYDAAQTSDENERHWANADYLSANAALRPGIRKRIRARARYEAQENNSYAKGMILTLANDLIGTGPRLQLMTKNKDVNRRVEAAFNAWSKESRLAEKLRTMRIAKVVDGEAFALFTNNRKFSNPVQLDITPIEADVVEAPYDVNAVSESEEVDGIRFDNDGNPREYFILKEHPGALTGFYVNSDGVWTPEKNVLHLYRQDRAQQRRGVSEIVTALPLFAMLRRFTLATLAAAETAADFAAVMRTTSNATTEAAALGEDEWFDAIPLEYRAMLTLPEGWDITQLKSEHPTTTYKMFKAEIVNEIARCLNMPFNVAAANSAEYNYASGRMDHQVYFKSIYVERSQWECSLLRRIFMAWLKEAANSELGLIPQSEGNPATWNYSWHWDGFEHVDPSKTASARETNLTSGTTNRVIELSKDGIDIDIHDEAAAESYGVSKEEYRAALFKQKFGGTSSAEEPEDDVEDSGDESDGEAVDAFRIPDRISF